MENRGAATKINSCAGHMAVKIGRIMGENNDRGELTEGDFVAVDVETANASRASICQIGVARFAGGRMVGSWQSLVDPGEPFHPFNVALHGIGPDEVSGAPGWGELYAGLRRLVAEAVVVSHTFFDRGAIDGACRRLGLPELGRAGWVDSCRAARMAWPELDNHKLPTLARRFGIEYRAHDALEDARVAGEVLVRALGARRIGLDELPELAKVPVRPRAGKSFFASRDNFASSE